MVACDFCNKEVPDGLIHVPGERVGGRTLREPTVHQVGEYEPAPDPGCNAVTEQELHEYLAAHCENCGSVQEEERVHHAISPGSCALVPHGTPPPDLVFDVPQPGQPPPDRTQEEIEQADLDELESAEASEVPSLKAS